MFFKLILIVNTYIIVDLANHNVKEYMKNAAYSLSKNDQNVEKKIGEYVCFLAIFRNLGCLVYINRKKWKLLILRRLLAIKNIRKIISNLQ